jgi:hypothetical protein
MYRDAPLPLNSADAFSIVGGWCMWDQIIMVATVSIFSLLNGCERAPACISSTPM